MNLQYVRQYYNTRPVEFVIKENYSLKEDNLYVPRFQLKNAKEKCYKLGFYDGVFLVDEYKGKKV